MKIYGIIGNPLTKSISKEYFLNKFKTENISDSHYEIYQLKNIQEFKRLITSNPQIEGLNVTTPYKVKIMPFLDFLDVTAFTVGAVNTIKVEYKNKQKKLKGFNTDIIGFSESITPLIKDWHSKALIIGTGGGALAASYILRNIGVKVTFLSRNPFYANQIGYEELTKKLIESHKIIVNATPIGMYINEPDCPQIPYQFLNDKHLIYDMVYSNDDTAFIKNAKEYGATTINGNQMFEIQAQKSWEIWNNIMPAKPIDEGYSELKTFK